MSARQGFETEVPAMLQALWKSDFPSAADALAEQIVESVREPLLVLDAGLRVRWASEDVTNRPASERRLRDFMLLVGHELRNPLAAIIGYAQLMQRRGAYDEQALLSILAQAGQINRLVGDLLDSARLEAGQLQLEPSRTDLVAVARGSMQQAQLTSPLHVVRLASPAGPLEGWWDRGRLEQVFANLLGNAIKYSPAGGEVLLAIDDLGTAVRVSIRDQGAGIAPEALPRLFEPFFRVDATAGGVQGLGVGLHVVKALVEAHGGAISVESVPGRGTIFSFTLPRLGRALPPGGDQVSALRPVGGEIAASFAEGGHQERGRARHVPLMPC